MNGIPARVIAVNPRPVVFEGCVFLVLGISQLLLGGLEEWRPILSLLLGCFSTLYSCYLFWQSSRSSEWKLRFTWNDEGVKFKRLGYGHFESHHYWDGFKHLRREDNTWIFEALNGNTFAIDESEMSNTLRSILAKLSQPKVPNSPSE